MVMLNQKAQQASQIKKIHFTRKIMGKIIYLIKDSKKNKLNKFKQDLYWQILLDQRE